MEQEAAEEQVPRAPGPARARPGTSRGRAGRAPWPGGDGGGAPRSTAADRRPGPRRWRDSGRGDGTGGRGVLGERDDAPLLGAVETLGLMVNPLTREVRPMGRLPMYRALGAASASRP